METQQIELPSFEQVKELYKEMLKDRAKEKYRIWDREYKKRRYETDPEFREKRKAQSQARRDKKKIEQSSNQHLQKS